MKLRARSLHVPALGLLGLLAAALPAPARADEDPWAPGKQWLSVRAGFANSAVRGSGEGSFGYGFGYSRILRPVKIYKWSSLGGLSLGGYVHHEMLGGFDGAREIEVPATVELVRHFRWNSSYRPYLGLGSGGFYRKTYRTGADIGTVKPGYYVTLGANAPIGGRNLLGFDFRMVRVSAVYDPPNPVFGSGSIKRSTSTGANVRQLATHWSAKLNWSLTY